MLYSSQDTLYYGMFYLAAGATMWRAGYRTLRGEFPPPDPLDHSRYAESWRWSLGLYEFLGFRNPVRADGIVVLIISGLLIGAGLLAIYEGLYWRAMGWTGPA